MIDSEKNIKYKVQKTHNKVILTIKNPKLLNRTYKNLFYQDSRIRTTTISRKQQDVVIYFWINKNYKIKSFLLKPNKKYPHHRLVIDIIGKVKKEVRIEKKNKKIIIIDAGHGGEDSGALGSKIKEKDSVLKIAKMVKKLIDKHHNLKAILTRKGDYFVSLSNRPKITQNNKALAFVSIHADSAIRKSAKGASVYILSKRGGNTKLAKRLEKTENATDIFDNQNVVKDIVLNTIMRDLARENRKAESIKLANSILRQLKKISHLHKEKPQKANFVVLKTPAIPSVLVETAFISNRIDEKRLTSPREQKKIANAIYLGILNYFMAE